MAMLDADGVPYSFGEWGAQGDRSVQDAAAEALIAKGLSANMVRFEAGTVLAGQSGMEHMASFDYAYKLAPVRDPAPREYPRISSLSVTSRFLILIFPSSYRLPCFGWLTGAMLREDGPSGWP